MKRSNITLQEVMGWPELLAAFQKAARGKRHRSEVKAVSDHLHARLSELQKSVLQGRYRAQPMHCFVIRDPKQRLIHAPAFIDRVLHHAVMAGVAPVLSRALVNDTFACLPGRGSLAAVQRAQQHARRFPWYVKTDVAAYFPHINHQRLLLLLQGQFKDPDLLGVLQRIVTGHQHAPGCGLPIGALSSQHFANTYLSGLDRLLLEKLKVPGMVRYMDDTVWWCRSKTQAIDTLAEARVWLKEHRALEFKPEVAINRSTQGLPFCGYRIFADALRMSLRMRRRYTDNRARWEAAWLRGDIDSLELQAGLRATEAAVQHAHSRQWRTEQLSRHPPHEDLHYA